MPRAFHLDGRIAGEWLRLQEVTSNDQRLMQLEIGRALEALRVTIDEMWGSETTRVFAFYLG